MKIKHVDKTWQILIITLFRCQGKKFTNSGQNLYHSKMDGDNEKYGYYYL